MEKELADFDISSIEIMSILVRSTVEPDLLQDSINSLHKMKLEHAQLLGKIELLQEKVNVDEKTGLLKYNSDFLGNTVKIASRTLDNSSVLNPFSVGYVRFDIDDFSIFNNRYGHAVGDKVLLQVANIIKQHSRPTDFCIRFGGEEFDVMLPSTPLSGVEIYVKKIEEAVKKLSIENNGESLSVSLSAGISHTDVYMHEMRSRDYDSINNYIVLQNEADDALYEAKFLGKARYSVYNSDKHANYKEFRNLYSNAKGLLTR